MTTLKQENKITIVFTAKFQWEIIVYEKFGSVGPSLRWLILGSSVLIVDQHAVQISVSQKFGTQNYNIIYEPITITHDNLRG